MIDLTKTKYQWLVTKDWDLLHFIAEVKLWDENYFDVADTQFDGNRPWASACGLDGPFTAPGILTRMGALRCEECCHKIGITSGKGSAINDDSCKLVQDESCQED
jgi:hypothetical protein